MAPPQILIVDDEIIIAREIERRLRDLGYGVAGIASSGAEAIRLAEEKRPSLVLMDIVLRGDMDGIEAAAEIRRRCHVPVIYVTAYTDKETLERAKVTEPFAYIVKPFSERELNANIAMALYKHRVEGRLRRLEQWFGTATDDVAEAVIATDEDGLITSFNPAAEAITEWTREEAIGRKMQDVFRLVDRENGHPVSLEGTDEGPVVCLAGETHLMSKSDRKVPVDNTTSVVRDDQDRATGTVSIFRHLTSERHNALVALNGDVALAASRAASLQAMLQQCAEAMVRHLDAAFARIWTLDPTASVLVLQASAGMYTHLDGPHGRVPVGKFKIGLIAEERAPHLTNDVLNDPRVSDPVWARREGMVAFAGHPLIVEGRLVGVMAMFSREALAGNVLDALGSVANAIAVAIERKQNETERDKVLAMLRMQIERMPLAYVLFDAENRITEWNPAAERIFGYRKEEMIGHDPFEKLVPASASQQARGVLERLRSGDMSAHSVNQTLTKDGRVITCEWLNTPLIAEDGQVRGVLSLALDVTERARLQDQVHQAQHRLQRVVTSSPAVLYVLEGEDARSLRLMWMSENVREMMGYGLEEAMDPQWWHQRVHPDDRDHALAELQADLFSRDRLAQEYRFRHKDGEYRWVRSELRLLRDDAGKPTEIVGSWSDITERKGLEQQFRQAQKMEAVGQLAGGVAHDFNNLLTVISGYSELLLRNPALDEVTKQLIGHIGKAGERAASLTRQLLAFSRKQVLEPKVLDLNALVTEQEKMLRRLIGEDVVLSTSLGASVRHVKADRGQLEQVIMNLAVNARDAMREGGKLTIETSNVELDESYAQTHPDCRVGPHVMLAMSDTGCGMSAELMSHIFEPFFTTKGLGKGTGLGLATVYGIIKQSDGHVAVYSEPGVGTSFKIFLPPAEERARSVQPATGLRPLPKGSETILLVEDEDAVRAIAQHTLQSCGYKVLECRGGAEAIRVCDEHEGTIHIIVSDVVMPEMPGRQVAEHLTKRRPGIRVLFMSGYTDDAVIRHGILQAETAFLQKPFTPLALATKVREVLDQAVVTKL